MAPVDAAVFEASRPRLRGIAYRMLGSVSDADDAVQEAWIHASSADSSAVRNLDGWLTTIVSRVCLDMLRWRKSRAETAMEPDGPEVRSSAPDPEEEAELADSVGRALLVVLDRLSPAERVAYVLYEMFAVPFEDIGAITGRHAAAARKLASRARQHIGEPVAVAAGSLAQRHFAQQHEAASAFFAASRRGDLAALVAILDPDVVLEADAFAMPSGVPRTLRGASAVSRGAVAAGAAARKSGLALLDGVPGIIEAPDGRLRTALAFTVGSDGRITRIDVIADPARLAALRVGVIRLPGYPVTR